jgi:hypothetical protein
VGIKGEEFRRESLDYVSLVELSTAELEQLASVPEEQAAVMLVALSLDTDTPLEARLREVRAMPARVFVGLARAARRLSELGKLSEGN